MTTPSFCEEPTSAAVVTRRPFDVRRGFELAYRVDSKSQGCSHPSLTLPSKVEDVTTSDTQEQLAIAGEVFPVDPSAGAAEWELRYVNDEFSFAGAHKKCGELGPPGHQGRLYMPKDDALSQAYGQLLNAELCADDRVRTLTSQLGLLLPKLLSGACTARRGAHMKSIMKRFHERGHVDARELAIASSGSPRTSRSLSLPFCVASCAAS